MENAATSPKRECDSNVEITPEILRIRALRSISSPLIVKLPSYLQHPENWGPADATKPEAAVKVLVYVGTPSDRIGNDGDFYLEEETNLLYGPKANGTWPEDGVQVSGPVMRRKRREAQRAWSMDVPKKSFLRESVFFSSSFGIGTRRLGRAPEDTRANAAPGGKEKLRCSTWRSRRLERLAVKSFIWGSEFGSQPPPTAKTSCTLADILRNSVATCDSRLLNKSFAP